MINSVNSTNTVAVSSNDAFTQAEAVIQFAHNNHVANFDMMRDALNSGPMTEDQRTSLISMIIANPGENVASFIPMIMQTGTIDMSQISNNQIIESVEKTPNVFANTLSEYFIKTGLLTNIDQNSFESIIMKSFTPSFNGQGNDLQTMIDFGIQHNVSISAADRNQILHILVSSTDGPFPDHLIDNSTIPVLLNDKNFRNEKLQNSDINAAIVSSFDKLNGDQVIKELLDYTKTKQEPFTKDQINQMIDQAKNVNGRDLNSILNVLNQY